MDKEFLGQPAWIWAVGAAVVIGGYLYITHSKKSSSSGAAPSSGGGGGGGGKSTYTIHETISDLQSHPHRRGVR